MILLQLCKTLSLENYDDANKVNAMKSCLPKSDPVLKQDITCKLILVTQMLQPVGSIATGSMATQVLLFLTKADGTNGTDKTDQKNMCNQLYFFVIVFLSVNLTKIILEM